MDVFEIVSRDVFASLIKDVSAKSEQDEKMVLGNTEEDEERRNILDVFPTEILHHILSFLSHTDLCELRLVCQKMKMVATSPQVFKLRISRCLGENELESKELEPLLGNVTSMIVYNINNAWDQDDNTENTSVDDEIPAKIFQKLDVQCPSLHELRIEMTSIPSTVSMNVHASLAERLTRFDLHSVTFKNMANFLPATYAKLKCLCIYNCTLEGEAPLDGLSEIRMPNLEQLDVQYMEKFGDKDFLQLTQGNLGKLIELNLSSLEMKGEDFGKLDLANLRDLNVTTCEFDDEWLSQLKNLRRLETFKMNAMHLKDICPRDTFKHLTELTTMEVQFSDLGNRIVSAMARHLPKLRRWELIPNEDGTITDEAFSGLIPHPHLEEINFDRLQLTDAGLRQIVLLSPNLKELSLSVCAAGDETVELVGKLQALVKLSLKGTRMTDVGLAALEPRFGTLQELTIQSRSQSLTVAGLTKSLRLLKPTAIVNVIFGEPECEVQYCIGDPENPYPYLTLKGLSSDSFLMFLQKFHGVRSLSLENVHITLLEVEQMSVSQPVMESITATQCEMSAEAAAAFGSNLIAVKYIYLNRSHVPEDVTLKFLMSMSNGKQLEQIHVEIDTFLCNDNLRKVTPIVSHCTFLQIHNTEYDKNISVNNTPENKGINVCGGGQLDDDVIVDLVRHLPEVTDIIVTQVMMTARGIAEIAPLVRHLTTFTLQSSTVGDDAISVIGRDFPRLTHLNLQCEHLTDDGLEALGDQLDTLVSITISQSSITDDGVRRLAPKLTTVTTSLCIYDNPNLTRELHTYMLATYPDIEHEDFPNREWDDGRQDENGHGEEDADLEPAVVDAVVEEPAPVEEAGLAPELAEAHEQELRLVEEHQEPA